MIGLNGLHMFDVFFPDLDFDTGDELFSLVINVVGGEDNIDVFIDVRVTPVNEHTPEFIENDTAVSLGEDSTQGTSVATMEARDSDINAHGLDRYLISSGNQAVMFLSLF